MEWEWAEAFLPDLHEVLGSADDGVGAGLRCPLGQLLDIFALVAMVIGKLLEHGDLVSAGGQGVPESVGVADPAERCDRTAL